MHGTKYDAAQSLTAYEQLTLINWTALPRADQRSETWVYYDSESGKDSTRLLVFVPYRIKPNIDVLTATWLADNYFRSLGSPNRHSRAPENNTNIDVAEMSESHLPNSSSLQFSLGPPVAALPSVPQRRQKFLAHPVMSLAIVPTVSASRFRTVVDPSASVMALFVVGVLRTTTASSNPSFTVVSSAVPLSLG